MTQSRRKRKDETRIKGVIKSLIHAAKSLQRRQELGRQEVESVNKAFALLQVGVQNENKGKTADRQRHYHKFLKRVEEMCGIQIVVLCAIGLGQSTVGDLSRTVRSELPELLKEQISQLECEFLDKVATDHVNQGV